MWRTADGVVHFNRIATPGDYIGSSLRERLDKLTDEEKVALYYQLDGRVGECLSALASANEFDERVEDDFNGQWLPETYSLQDSASESVESLVLRQADLIPDRWRVEFLSLAPSYLLDTGPNWRRWKRIMRKLQANR